MKRDQLEHIIRAAAANADTDEIVVIGSQSVLATCGSPQAEVLSRSMEADVFPLRVPANSILIDGAIGERSVFHQTFGYYAHGVGEDTAILPEGWRDRLVPISNENTRGCTGWCLEVNDLAVSKLVAGRSKDVDFVAALFAEQIADPVIARERLKDMDWSSSELREAAFARLDRL